MINLGCVTNGGEAPNKPCKLSWKFCGREYKGCANPFNDPKGDWCPTELNFANEFVPKSGNWGYCSSNCKRDKGNKFDYDY